MRKLPGPEGLQCFIGKTWLSSWMWQLPGPEGLQCFSSDTWLSFLDAKLPGPEGLQWLSSETWLSSWMLPGWSHTDLGNTASRAVTDWLGIRPGVLERLGMKRS